MTATTSESPKEPTGDKEAVRTLQRVTDDDLYRHSSQYRLWSFTPEQLNQRRIDINARAALRTDQNLKEFKEAHKELTDEELTALELKAVPVTVEEEYMLVNYYAKMIISFAGKMNLPTEVAATAASFLRRFYLVNSVMDIVPKEIFYTTLFFACKSENYFIGVESFAKKTKSTPESILKHEFKLLESLQFTLMNHHPYKALHGFFLDIQTVLQGKVDLKYMGQVYNNCKKTITDALLTDAVYFFTPPQITLAALLREDEALTSKYLELKFNIIKDAPNEDGNSDPIIDSQKRLNGRKLLEIIRNCKEIISRKNSTKQEELSRIAAKIHFSQNPQSVIERVKRQQQSSSATPDPEESQRKKQKT
ncbi:LAFE_0B09648g1_1 [Lachancea fermentati]|uniref:LAFE_0B09648g1_1 n=1 Tax=Lachancea fermentati TaxID=4955 RepID=A0A1G4M8N1_LACFM|nr:LAFE_0B09648g1_1 [Lachancea fermentati]